MPVITNITKKGRYFYLTLDNDEKISLLGIVAQKYSLQSHSQIPDDLLKKIIAESELQRGRDYVTYLLSRRAYSYGQLLIKLNEKQYDREISITILTELKEAGLVDDIRFARQMVESMLRHKPAGRAFMVAALRKKYISRELAEETVDDYLKDIDETDIAVRLLRTRWRYFSKFELETARRKAYNYLSRRSIGYRSAKAAFEKVAEEEK